MELDKALLLMAQALDRGQSAEALTDQARAALTRALRGSGGDPGPPQPALQLQQAWLAAWCQSQQAGAAPEEVYQQMLALVVCRAPGGSLSVRRERGAHRATGAYYTTETVVRYMAERARIYRPDAETVVDPSCGAGAFLMGARRAFGSSLKEMAGLDLDPVAVDLCRSLLPEVAVREADALLEPAGGPYDLCLGNPPYISSGLRGAARQEAERQSALRQRYRHTGQYKLNTYPLFIERGLELLKDGGVLGYIVPDSFLTGRYFAGLRRLLLSHTLLELTLIRRDFWPHGRVGQSVILFVRKGAAPPGHQTGIRCCDDVSQLEITPLTPLPPGDFVWGALERFRLVTEPSARQVLAQMEQAARPAVLGDFLRTYSGLIGRAGQQSLLRSHNPSAAGPRGRLLRSGSEIDRYQLRWAGEEVSLDPALIKSGGHLAYYQRPKILMRQTADSLRAVCDEEGFYCLNNIHLLIPTVAAPDLRALLGLINSGPASRWYREVTMEAGRLYPQVDLDLLSLLPVPPMDEEQATFLAGLVRQREKAAPEEAAHWDRQIDEYVAELYGLPYLDR